MAGDRSMGGTRTATHLGRGRANSAAPRPPHKGGYSAFHGANQRGGGRGRRGTAGPHGGSPGTLRPATLSPHAVPSLPLLGSGCVPTEAPGEASARPLPVPPPSQNGMAPRGGVWDPRIGQENTIVKEGGGFPAWAGRGQLSGPFPPGERAGGPSPKALGVRRGPPGKPRCPARPSGQAAGPGRRLSAVAVPPLALSSPLRGEGFRKVLEAGR